MFATISAAEVTEYGTLIGIFLVAILTHVNAYNHKKSLAEVANAQQNSDQVSEQSRNTNTVKMNALTNRTEEIHALVNSGMATQLRLAVVLSQRLAAITKAPDDQLVATLALQKYEEHMTKQAIADCANANGCDLVNLVADAKDKAGQPSQANP